MPDIISPEFLATFRAHGVVKAFLFGGMSRGEERPDSDVDLLVTCAEITSPFNQMDLADERARLCGRPVDLMAQVYPVFEPYIWTTLVLLPLRCNLRCRIFS